MRIAALLLLSLSVVSARADSLTDLKNTLASLRATSAVRVGVEIQRTEIDRGKKPATTQTGAAAVEAIVDAEGLHLGISPALLARAQKEQNDEANNPDKNSPTVDALDRLSPLPISLRLDFGKQLLSMLSRAELQKETRVVYEGRPARLLALKLKTIAPKSSIGHVEILEDSLNIWLADDNIPLAAQRIERYTGGIMFVKAQGTNASRWNFTRKDDRLVAVRSESKSTLNGFGQNTDNTEVITVSLR